MVNPLGSPTSKEPFGRIFYPSVSERERAAVIRVAAGEIVDNLDLVIPKLEETVTIKGVLRFSDGKPASDQSVRFRVGSKEDAVHSDTLVMSDTAGQFELKVLKGLAGELSGDYYLLRSLYPNCPKVEELFAKSDEPAMTVHSNVLKLTPEQNLYALDLTLPIPFCEKVK